MPIIELNVRDVGFQSAKTFIPYVDPDPAQAYVDYVAQSLKAEMQFLNDGYTFVYVFNPFDDPGFGNDGQNDITVTFTAVPDNAGRIQDLAERVPFGASAICGPFRPVWWNYGGKVDLSAAFSVPGGGEDINDASISAFRLQF